MRSHSRATSALALSWTIGLLLTVTGCADGSGEQPASSPPTPTEPATTSSASPQAPSPTPTPSATVPSSTAAPATPSAAAGKPRVCYQPSTWKRYACTEREFARNKAEVRTRLPSSTASCLNAQVPKYYCYQPSHGSDPSGR